jgi:hypothetical protein
MIDMVGIGCALTIAAVVRVIITLASDGGGRRVSESDGRGSGIGEFFGDLGMFIGMAVVVGIFAVIVLGIVLVAYRVLG